MVTQIYVDFFIVLPSWYYMGQNDIFKPLSTFFWSVPLANLSNIKINFWENRESKPGPLVEKQECYLYAVPHPPVRSAV